MQRAWGAAAGPSPQIHSQKAYVAKTITRNWGYVFMKKSRRTLLLATSTIVGLSAGLGVFADAATAQTSLEAAAKPTDQVGSEVVVTGSRIKRAHTDTTAPVAVIGVQDLAEHGFVSAVGALNTETSIAPAIPQSVGNAQTLGSGASYPNLFNLGAGRTLTLLDGQRMVTTNSGLGDRTVDVNVIPTGLIDHVDVVQAGGAAVYGSDAIAGVINYVLKKNFQGVEMDAQTGISSRDDFRTNSARITAGQNFNDNRGNIAVNVEWSKAPSLLSASRPETNPFRITAANPADTGPNDGIPALIRIYDARFYAFNPNGVIFTIPAPVALPPCGGQICFLRSGGTPQQFSADGQSLIAYNPGAIFNVPFAKGGQGESFGDLASIYVGVKRFNVGSIGHYDITDHMKLSGSVLYSEVTSTDPLGAGQGGVTHTILNSPATGAGYIVFTKNNPFLSAGDITALSAASPSFAAGALLFLSKAFTDLLPTNASEIKTQTARASLNLDGDFSAGPRNFYYSIGLSHGEVIGETSQYGQYTAHFNNAINAVKNASGQIVCSINATTVVDPSCVPLNPFGIGVITNDMRAYSTIFAGERYVNMQDDFLATLGGDILKLPAGAAKFSVSYEHRNESAKFKPGPAEMQGLVGQNKVTPTRGEYHTDEFSGEVLAPLVGGDFTLPWVKALELSGQYRYVENSIAGDSSVWGLGARWTVFDGLTARLSRSRNFRAPTLNQLFAPAVTALGGVLIDPCDARYVNAGPNPAVRLANCTALFAANPGYNGGKGLAGYNDPNTNTAGASITTGGNPALRNETSDTFTYGLVIQPRMIPGLTITADRLQVDIGNGLTAYAPANFLQACFDSSAPFAQNANCSTFTRNANGDVATAISTTVNAAEVRYRGETYNIDYRFGLADALHQHGDWGRLDLTLEATHNDILDTFVTGVRTRAAGTTAAPRWVGRFDVRWNRGPWRALYEAQYLSETMVNRTDTIETTPTPIVKANLRHTVSASYDFGRFQVRAGVNNLTDERPSFPTTTYGDIIGRYYFVGLKARFQ
jgi:iron complex outermembrane recepter protein